VATQHTSGTFFHFFLRSLHDYRKNPTYFVALSKTAGDTCFIVRPSARVVMRREAAQGRAQGGMAILMSVAGMDNNETVNFVCVDIALLGNR
jgi:hypothetical protein